MVNGTEGAVAAAEKRYQQKDDNSHKLRTPKIKTFNKINGQRYIFMGALALPLSLYLSAIDCGGQRQRDDREIERNVRTIY